MCFVSITEPKATTNQKLRIYDTIAARTNNSNFSYGIQLLGDHHCPWVPISIICFWSELHAAIMRGPFLFVWIFFFFFLSWMYDLGVWARMTGSSKAQGRRIPFSFWVIFSCFSWASLMTLLAGIACCCRLSDEKQAFQGHNWRILYGP